MLFFKCNTKRKLHSIVSSRFASSFTSSPLIILRTSHLCFSQEFPTYSQLAIKLTWFNSPLIAWKLLNYFFVIIAKANYPTKDYLKTSLRKAFNHLLVYQTQLYRTSVLITRGCGFVSRYFGKSS